MESKTYFKREDVFIDELRKKYETLFSSVIVETPNVTPEDFIDRDNFAVEYLESIWFNIDKKMFHIEGIFKNKSDIYFYLSQYDGKTYKLKIIYEVSKLNEVTFFIKQLNKLKNGN